MDRQMPHKRVVIISPVHPADDIRVAKKEAHSLAQAGYQVILISQPTSSSPPISGIEYHPLKVPHTRAQRFLQLPALVWKAVRLRGDIYHLHNPDTLPIGLALRIFGRRVVYDTHEDYSQRILVREWIPPWLRRPLAALIHGAEYLATFLFSHVIVTQQELADKLGGRATVIENPPLTTGPALEEAHRLSPSIDPGASLRLVYMGSMSASRGLFRMVRLLEEINKHQSARLWLIGQIPEDLLSASRAMHGWEWVDYLGPLDQGLGFAHVSRANVGLLLLDEVADYPFTSPNKLFEYMLLGIPFLANDFPKWRNLLVHLDAGWFVSPDDFSQILKWINALITEPSLGRQMGARGRKYILETFNWEKENQKLIDLYKKI